MGKQVRAKVEEMKFGIGNGGVLKDLIN